MYEQVDLEKLDKAIGWFANYINTKDRNSQSVDFYSGFMEYTEGYKREIYKNAHAALHLDQWDKSLIGTHQILDYVLDTLHAKSNRGFNNIIDFHSITELKQKCEEDLLLFEDILFQLFTSDDIGTAFTDACSFIGEWYPLLSYLLFIRDCSKYLPVKNSEKNHFDRFQKLGLSVNCLKRCSWDNYQEFLTIHHVIQNRLKKYFFASRISLLDAHSFVWTLHAAPVDLSMVEKTAYKDSNDYFAMIMNSLENPNQDENFIQSTETELDNQKIVGKEREAFVKIRCNQYSFRDKLQLRYRRCCLCGVSDKRLLIASHIKPWAASDDYEKLDVNNGLLLCPNHDKVFDQGFISFNEEGKILISSQLSQNDKIFLNLHEDMHIQVREENIPYLFFHRNAIFLDRQI